MAVNPLDYVHAYRCPYGDGAIDEVVRTHECEYGHRFLYQDGTALNGRPCPVVEDECVGTVREIDCACADLARDAYEDAEEARGDAQREGM